MFFFTLICGLDYGPAGVTIAEDADDHLIKLLDPLHSKKELVDLTRKLVDFNQWHWLKYGQPIHWLK